MIESGPGTASAANGLVFANAARALIRLSAQLLEKRAGTPNLIERLRANIACRLLHVSARTHNALAPHHAIRKTRQAAPAVARFDTDLVGDAHELRGTRRLHFYAYLATRAQDIGEQFLILLDTDNLISEVRAESN